MSGLEREYDETAIGHWFGPPERPLLGWLSVPRSGPGQTGVLILPPIGYAYWSSHRTLRVIAQTLAGAGYLVLRIDYDGTGDSAGEQWDGERLLAWRRSAAAGAEELRRLGCARLVLLGARLGGGIALRDGAALGADAVIAWAPVISGRRYVREIRLLAGEATDGGDELPPGTLFAGGSVYLRQTLDELGALSSADIAVSPAPRVLIVAGGPDADETALVSQLAQLGCAAEQRSVPSGESALAQPAEYATVPEQLVTTVADWLGPGAPGEGPATLEARCAGELQANGALVREALVTLGPEGLVAVQSEPTSGDAAATLVLLNTGSEPHIGPGRAWVEYARALAAGGYRCLRVDFRGWGESPDGGFAPGRPYDAHCVQDAVAIVRALRERGEGPIVVAGLCASAWVALRMVLREPVEGIVALNPQLYWQPGDPVEALMSETRTRRTPERGREALGGRCGLWSALDVLGQRPWAARWLDELAATGVPITLAFAAGDDGIEFLESRHARRLAHALRAGSISVVEIPDIDHSMARVWLRDRVVAVLRERLAAATAPDRLAARGR